MFPTPTPVRRHWRRSKRTAEAVSPVRRFLPTNQIRDAVMTRRGLKWGVPAMLLAAPYLLAIKILTDFIAQAGPGWGWLHLVVLLCAYNTWKMLWLGPISLIHLARARLHEHAEHRKAARAEQVENEPVPVMAGAAS